MCYFKTSVCTELAKMSRPAFFRQMSRRTVKKRIQTIASYIGFLICLLVATNILAWSWWQSESRARLYDIYPSIQSPPQEEVTYVFENEDVDKSDNGSSVNKYSKKENVIHVILMVDRKVKSGLPLLLSSILKNTNHTVIFHLGYCEKGDDDFVRSYLSCFQIPKLSDDILDFVYVNFGKLMDSTFRNYLQIIKPKDTLPRCVDLLPVKIHKAFPKLEKALFLQEDMMVLGDISELWKIQFSGGKMLSIARPMHHIQTYKTVLKDSVETYKLFQLRYNKSINVGVKIYDTSVTVFNLHQWKRKREYLETEINFWMKAAVKLSKKYQSSQDPWWIQDNDILLQLFLQEEITVLPFTHWHVNGLGKNDVEKLSPQKVARAKLLHWDGPNKPWDSSDAMYRDYWKAHIPKRRSCPKLDSAPQSKHGGILDYFKYFFSQSDTGSPVIQ